MSDGLTAESHLHGLLIVDKPGLEFHQWDDNDVAQPEHLLQPRLPTSHDIVQQVRRWSGQRRIGHTGTLDPFASGVLVLCLGHATRLVEYYQGHDKTYLAEVVLGVATDTYDITGAVTKHISPPTLSTTAIEGALTCFRGPVMQTPPIYSALKQGGESLHEKARRGEEVVVTPRPIIFHSIDLLSFTPPDRITLRVHSSAGAYIRSLAHDLGQALATVAHLAALRREAAGPFTLRQAHTLADIQKATQADSFDRLLQPLGIGLDLPIVQVDADAARRFGFGQVVAVEAERLDQRLENMTTATQEFTETILAQGRAPDGQFVGVLRWLGTKDDDGRTHWKAEKWFAG